ncbi:CBS domain-containing protein [Bacillus licheniformis]|jgi:CBS domain-containing protein|uniref:CBS domain protein n=2 Tax=Bacillus licheniformis TaxID=1402 RepID=Q65E15_BACLD|nr:MULTISPECIES: CBS domain-containing protein [Bacillus]MBY8348264.1 CBS domain-containing protein [Bacillus sp. PCH94]MDP4082369.1 CBS domain-containing protein [Bacillota bacterium]AAU25325.1 CBS domain protein [Bacillus licheniformis DSM 13 = ATCC 14580]AAU42699.1 putative forespore-specific sporulation protein [Bacillus licheniformis DSM 13 = ATCC 14580]AKQ75152.1 CBS domain-containing protein [Bacillus licheniformis WX-02]
MKLKDIMTTNAECCEPSAPIAEIAGKMRDYNVGSIPVCENGKLTGIVSDRDIVIRCVAENETDAAARDIMSTQMVTGRPDMSAEEAGDLMAEHQIRRLPIVEDDRLVGIVALGDLSVSHADEKAGEALSEISKPA